MEQDELFDIGSGNELSGVAFGLFSAKDLKAADGSVIPAGGLIETVTFGSGGKAVCKTDLPVGSYYLQELSTDSHYKLGDTRYPVEFAYAGPGTAVVRLAANGGKDIENELIYGSVSGTKRTEDGEGLGGAVIGLFKAGETEFTRKTAILMAISADDGSFRFERIPYGKWLVREIEQPKGFVLNDEVFTADINQDGANIKFTIANRFIRGNLSLTKYDADYPENKLSGAEFNIYRDTNGNKAFDKTDELIGTMKETKPGLYEMKDLLYGGVFVKEKTAPEGFYLDENAYYVFIDTDGKTYTVENEAGKGFINQAHRGALKIVKTSDDGKVEGFSFRVTGKDYDKVFKTDSKGEILIEGLRVGQYTVTELEDSVSAGYKRPDPVTVELVVDETLTVRVHNDKVTVDVPKTGDETDLWIWILTGVLGAGGLAATILVSRRKKSRPAKR
jgi:LPXTG-motif cell wall-anchored protein